MRGDIVLHTYIHADGEDGTLPVEYDALRKTFDDVDELRMDLHEKRKTCMIVVLIDGHGENDSSTKLVMNTSKNSKRLFDIEMKVRSFASGNDTCFVFANFNCCRRKGVGPITQPLGGETVGNLMLKFTC